MNGRRLGCGLNGDTCVVSAPHRPGRRDLVTTIDDGVRDANRLDGEPLVILICCPVTPRSGAILVPSFHFQETLDRPRVGLEVVDEVVMVRAKQDQVLIGVYVRVARVVSGSGWPLRTDVSNPGADRGPRRIRQLEVAFVHRALVVRVCEQRLDGRYRHFLAHGWNDATWRDSTS